MSKHAPVFAELNKYDATTHFDHELIRKKPASSKPAGQVASRRSGG